MAIFISDLCSICSPYSHLLPSSYQNTWTSKAMDWGGQSCLFFWVSSFHKVECYGVSMNILHGVAHVFEHLDSSRGRGSIYYKWVTVWEWLVECCGPTQFYDPPRCEDVVLQALASPPSTAVPSLLWWTDISQTMKQILLLLGCFWQLQEWWT